jgi:hypothetical protein
MAITTQPAPSLPEPLPAPAPAVVGIAAQETGATTLLDLLRASTARYAKRPALLIKPGFRTRLWIHGDLAELAPKVARVLADIGLGKGDRVVIWVPMRLKVHRFSRLDAGAGSSGERRPWRGEVEIVFGAPIHFPWGTPHDEATSTLEQAVGAL